MNNDKIIIPKSFLASGQNLQITDSLYVKHPIIQDILHIGIEYKTHRFEDIYYSWVSIFLCDPYDYMVYLDDKGLDYEEVKPFDLFIMRYRDMVDYYESSIKPTVSDDEYANLFMDNVYFKAFRFFLDKDYFILAKTENGDTVVADYDTNSVMIDDKIFTYVSEFIRDINGFKPSDKINPEDKFAKQILIDDERSRLKKIKKNEDDKINDKLGDLLSAVTWVSNGGITPFNRNSLHIYDIIDCINRNDKLINYKNTLTGIYSGCVDGKKIDFNKISWCS